MEIVTRYGVSLVSSQPRLPDGSLPLTDDDAEVIVVLGQLLYSELNRLLVYGQEDYRCSQIEKQFREDLEVREILSIQFFMNW